MDLAPPALDSTLDPAPRAPIPAPPATSLSDLDRAASELADRATAFARMPAGEKAALLRLVIRQIAAAAPEMAASACHAAGIDPASARAGGAWLTGPVALIAGARALVEALDDIATDGRPRLPIEELRGRVNGRVAVSLAPRGGIERALHRGAEPHAILAEGVEPEDVIDEQAAFYREREPAGGVALIVAAGGPPSAAPLAALRALFVEGRVAVVETSPARAPSGPSIMRALAPLIEQGFLRVIYGGEPAGAHLSAHPAVRASLTIAPASTTSPLIVVPCLYARDELWFTARRVASELAIGAAFDVPAPRVIVIPEHWAQRRLFLDTMRRALAGLGAWTLREGYEGEGELPATTVGVIETGGDDPIDMLGRALLIVNGRLGGAPSVEIMVHPIQEEDPAFEAALARAVVHLHTRVVALTEWPFMLELCRGERMLGRVHKEIVRGPLHARRRPAYFHDNARSRRASEALVAFHAAPGLGALFRVLRA